MSAARRSPPGKFQWGLETGTFGRQVGLPAAERLLLPSQSVPPSGEPLVSGSDGPCGCNPDLCAFGHLFFAPRQHGVVSLSASRRPRGLIFDSRICLLEASERFRPCLPVLSREGAVFGAWLGLEKALRIESGERSPVERRLRDQASARSCLMNLRV